VQVPSTHFSHLRLIGRGVTGFSFDFAMVQFRCDVPQESSQVPKRLTQGLNPRATISASGTLTMKVIIWDMPDPEFTITYWMFTSRTLNQYIINYILVELVSIKIFEVRLHNSS